MTEKNDFIAALKKVRVPLWARLLGNLRARRRARKARKRWELVTTITIWVHLRDLPHIHKPSWFTLYQRGDGKRRWKYETGGLAVNPNKLWDMHEIIVPWMHHKLTNKQVCDYAQKTKRAPA